MKYLLLVASLFLFSIAPCLSQEVTELQASQARAELLKSKPDSNRVALLFTIGRYHIVKVGELQEDLDTAISFINRGARLSKDLAYRYGTGYSYVLLSMAFREKGLRDKGREFADRAVQFNRSNNLSSLLGESLLETSQYFDFYVHEQSREKIQLTRKAALAFQQDANIKQEAYCLKHLGDLLSIADSIPEAIIVLKKALALYNSINYSHLHGTYDLLGALYSYIGDYENGLRYGLLAERTALQVQDSSLQLCTIYNRIGLTYYNLKDDKRAIEYLKKSYAVADRYGDRVSIYWVLGNLVRSYARIGYAQPSLALIQQTMHKYPITENNSSTDRLNVCTLYLVTYIAMKDFEAGQQYFNTALELSNVPNTDQRVIQRAYAQIVNFLMSSKQYDKAESYLKANHEHFKKNNAPTHLSQNYFQWYKLDSARGNFSASLSHYQHYRGLEDSLFNLNKSKQFETLTLEFETAKKDQEIKIKEQSIELLTGQAEIQKSELQRSQLIRNGTLISIAMLSIIMVLLYKQYQTKQKSNTLLQHLVIEKEWLLKEVHHRVKNNLQTVLSLLESQASQLKNEAFHAIKDSQNRVFAMSLIHKKLYQTTDVVSIDMKAYLLELTQQLRDSLDVKAHINFRVNVEPIELDVSQAVPIGLIVNEAVTNSLKYAFKESSVSNQIILTMKKKSDKVVELTISDNGVGISKPVDGRHRPGETSGLGLKLIKGLTEDLEGTLTFNREGGFTIVVGFIANVPLQSMGKSITTPEKNGSMLNVFRSDRGLFRTLQTENTP